MYYLIYSEDVENNPELKNVDFLIKAFGAVLAKDKNLQLEIIGEGPQEQELKNLAQKLNLEKNIIFNLDLVLP